MTRRTAKWFAGAAAAGLAAALPAHAMRCESRIISRGDHASKLLHYCGEPAFVQSHAAQGIYTGRGRQRFILPGFFEEIWVEEWTYNFGPYKLMRRVRLENGIVAEIKLLGYGYTAR